MKDNIQTVSHLLKKKKKKNSYTEINYLYNTKSRKLSSGHRTGKGASISVSQCLCTSCVGTDIHVFQRLYIPVSVS